MIDEADVIIEVLDARDPLGSRCAQVEEAILSSGPNKKLILLLNKIGQFSLFRCLLQCLFWIQASFAKILCSVVLQT